LGVPRWLMPAKIEHNIVNAVTEHAAIVLNYAVSGTS
jgi:hypothetical protein